MGSPRPDASGASAAAPASLRSNLVQVISMFFARPPPEAALLPHECEIFFGVHHRLQAPVSVIPDDPARATRLNAVLHHAISVDARAVKVTNPNHPYAYDARHVFDAALATHARQVFLDMLFIRGDLVWDDRSALELASFAFAAEVGALSTVVRQRNFQRHLSRVLPPDSVSDLSVSSFYAGMASNGTYDVNGDYYPKYRSPSPEQPEQRVLDGAHLSDEYLRHNFFEILPARRVPHVMFRAGPHRIVYELQVDRHGTLTTQVVLQTDTPAGESVWEYLTVRNPTGKPTEAIFFLSGAGPAKFVPPRIDNFTVKVPLGAGERVVDPRLWVRAQWEEPVDAADRFEREWDWFTTMADMRFGAGVYEVHVNRSELTGLDRKKLVLDPLNDALAQSTGEFRKYVSTAFEQAKRDPTVNFFVQGLALEASGNRRYIGSEHGYAYIRRREEGLTTRVTNQLFVQDLKIAVLADRVFQSTRHLIPIIMVFTLLATAVVAVPVIGAAALWSGFVWVVKDQVLNLATKPAVRQALNRFRRQLQFLMVDTLVSLFPKTNMKYVEFLRGFLHGFARDAIESLLGKYRNFVVHGPSYYRWYRMFSRMQASLNRLVAKVDELKGVIDAAAGRLLIDRFAHLGSRAQSASVLLFSNVYFLDYDAAEGAIEAYADLADQPPIRRAEWEKQRAERLRLLLLDYSAGVRAGAVTSVKASTALAYNTVRVSVKTVSLTQDFLLLARFSGHFAVVCLLAGVGGLAGLAALEITTTRGAIVKTLGRLLARGPVAIVEGRYSAAELNVLGRFLGHAVGGFFLNGAIFAKGTRLGKLKKPPGAANRSRLRRLKDNAISKFVSAEFGHGHAMPIIKLVLSHYLLLFQRLRAQSEDLWETIEADVKKQLYGTSRYQVFLDQGTQPISFEKARALLSMFDTILVGYLDELIATPDLDRKLAASAEYLKRARAPSWDDLLAGRAPAAFSREAMTFAAIAHLHAALDELSEMLRLIMDPVRVSGAHEVSILDIMNILGITTSEEEARTAVSEQLEPVFGNSEQRASERSP